MAIIYYHNNDEQIEKELTTSNLKDLEGLLTIAIIAKLSKDIVEILTKE